MLAYSWAVGTGPHYLVHTDNPDLVWYPLTGSARRRHRAIHRRCRLMALATDTDGIIYLTEARGARGVAFRNHLYIRRYPCGLWGYLQSHLCRWALEEVGAIERGRRIGVRVGLENVGGTENEGDMEGQTREAGTDTEKTEGGTAVGSVGAYRTHRVRASVSLTSALRLRGAQRWPFEDSSIFASNAPRLCCLAWYTHTFIT